MIAKHSREPPPKVGGWSNPVIPPCSRRSSMKKFRGDRGSVERHENRLKGVVSEIEVKSRRKAKEENIYLSKMRQGDWK